MSTIGDDYGLELPGGGLTDSQGHYKLHPISPVIHAVALLPALFGISIAIFAQSGSFLTEFFPSLGPIFLAIASIAILGFVLALVDVIFEYFRWRAFSFWLDSDGDLRVRSGIIFRNERRVQLSRMQAVDVVQPLAARIFSMATLVVEVAGQKDSRVSFKFLTLTHARELRQIFLEHSSPLSPASSPNGIESPVLFRLRSQDLAVSLLLRTSTVLLLALTLVILIGGYWIEGWTGVLAAILTGGVPILIIVVEFVTYYGFTITDSPQGLRMRYGLLKTENRTLPLGRVQAIDYIEPLLWRSRGWTRVAINIAGVGEKSQSGSSQTQDTLLIPVAEISLAREIVTRVIPDLDIAGINWHQAPARSIKRSPIQWRNLAMGWTNSAFAARRGKITRHTMVIPHARTQSVHMTQGPWERALNLASLHVDTTPGPVKVVARHCDVSEVAQTMSDQIQRSFGTPRRT